MTQDQLDKLVDDATHAVINMIPSDDFYELDADQREGLVVQINDYLTEALHLFLENDNA